MLFFFEFYVGIAKHSLLFKKGKKIWHVRLSRDANLMQ